MSAHSTEYDSAIYQEVIAQSGLGLGRVALDTGRVLHASPRLCAITGYDEADILRMSWTDLSPPEEATRMREILRHLATSTDGKHMDYAHIMRKDACMIYTRVTFTTVPRSNARTQEALMLVQDISEQTCTEAALRESEARFRALADVSPLLIWMSSPDHQGIYFNQSWCKLTGRTPEQVLGEGWLASVHPDDRDELQEQCAQAQRERRPFRLQFRLRRHDGAYRWVIDSGVPWLAPDGTFLGYLGSALDITEHIETEQALRTSEARFRRALRGSPITVFEQDRDLRYTWVDNPTICGHPPEEVIGKRDTDMMPAEDAAMLETIKRRVLSTGTGERCEIHVHRDGDRYFDLSVDALRDQTARVVGISCVAFEVTERVRLEAMLRSQTEQLGRADRRKDEFLAMLAHELRNPLAAIRNAIDLLRAPDAARFMDRAVGVIDRQTEQLASLVDDLLDVARISGGRIRLERQLVPVASIIERAVETIRPLAETRGQHLEVTLPPADVCIHADATRLAQVMGNLLHNAVKFTGAGGRITLGAVRQGSQIHISVRDTGTGIPDDLLARIFEPFVQADATMERSQGGLGLGLTLARSLVEMHGGTIEGRSAGPGMGSEFILHLPTVAACAEPDTHHAAHGSKTAARARSHILVVDDNADSADMLALLLAQQGHDVTTAYDGTDAIAKARELVPDVVLLDLGLPGISGFEVAQRLRQGHGRDMLLVALTGYGQPEDRRRTQEAGFDHHLLKPVDMDALREVIRKRTSVGRE